MDAVCRVVIKRTHPTESNLKKGTVSIRLVRRLGIILTSIIRTVSLASLFTSFLLLTFQTPSFSSNRTVNPVISTQRMGFGITGHPKMKTARYFFRVQNIGKFSIEIRDLGANVLNLQLVKPPRWSTPVLIAPGKSVPVAVVYRATSCRVMPNVSTPMQLQVRSGISSWHSIGIKLTAVNGPGRWERSVLNAACHVVAVVHGGFPGSEIHRAPTF
jgi:hypothetical protein